MVKLDLKEFAEATRRMVQHSGVKKTRLMLRVRPMSSRKTFVLKTTDGRTTFTTRVEHQGELKLVEGIVNDYVSRCTAALVSPPSAANAKAPSPSQSQSKASAGNAQTLGNTKGTQPQQQQQQQKPGGKSGGGNQQQQRGGGKKKKGGKR